MIIANKHTSLSLETQLKNINLDSKSIEEKIIYSLKLMLEILKIFYEKTIGYIEHWIYSSLEEMIESDENYDQNEIKFLKSTATLQVTKIRCYKLLIKNRF